MIRFGGHEDVIGFVIWSEGIGCEIEVIHRVDEPAIGKPNADTREQGENDEEPAFRGHRKISEQVTGGTQRHFLTVAVSRPWRGLEGSAAPGLPGRDKDNRSERGCQIGWSKHIFL